jgi:hypothetical protein
VDGSGFLKLDYTHRVPYIFCRATVIEVCKLIAQQVESCLLSLHHRCTIKVRSSATLWAAIVNRAAGGAITEELQFLESQWELISLDDKIAEGPTL